MINPVLHSKPPLIPYYPPQRNKGPLSIMLLTLFANLVLVAFETAWPCPPPITEMPILVTWYDPALGGINCDEDCTTFADGTLVTPDDYGRVGACIPEWLGASITIADLGTFECRDTGPSIVIAYNEYYRGWVIHVDILHDKPPEWNYQLYNWQLNWSPVPEPTISYAVFGATAGFSHSDTFCSQQQNFPSILPKPPEQFFSVSRLTYRPGGGKGVQVTT